VKRREFIVGLLFSAVTPHVQVQQPEKVYRIAIAHASVPVKEISETGSLLAYEALFDELRRLG
jgi:hypothetical protein